MITCLCTSSVALVAVLDVLDAERVVALLDLAGEGLDVTPRLGEPALDRRQAELHLLDDLLEREALASQQEGGALLLVEALQQDLHTEATIEELAEAYA